MLTGRRAPRSPRHQREVDGHIGRDGARKTKSIKRVRMDGATLEEASGRERDRFSHAAKSLRDGLRKPRTKNRRQRRGWTCRIGKVEFGSDGKELQRQRRRGTNMSFGSDQDVIGTMDVLCDELIDASATLDGEKVVAAEHQNG